MMTLYSTIQKHLSDTRDSLTADRQLNNAFARKITIALSLGSLSSSTVSVILVALRRSQVQDELSFKFVRMFSSSTFSTYYFASFADWRIIASAISSDNIGDVFQDVKRRHVARGCVTKDQ